MALWTVEVIEEAEREIKELPADVQGHFLHIAGLIEEEGPHRVGMPLVRPLERKLWEMRLRGRDGIARAIYFTAAGRRLIVVRAFVKKTERTPRREIELALRRMRAHGGD